MALTFKLIASNTLSSDAISLNFSSIPQTYTDLVLYMSTRNVTAVEEWLQVGFNDSTSNYSDRLLWNDENVLRTVSTGDAPPFAGSLAQSGSASNTWSNNCVYIYNYTASVGKSYLGMSAQANTSNVKQYWGFHNSRWADTSAITKINIKTRQTAAAISSGSTFYLYGIKNS